VADCTPSGPRIKAHFCRIGVRGPKSGFKHGWKLFTAFPLTPALSLGEGASTADLGQDERVQLSDAFKPANSGANDGERAGVRGKERSALSEVFKT
jgi:hypothetical protein